MSISSFCGAVHSPSLLLIGCLAGMLNGCTPDHAEETHRAGEEASELVKESDATRLNDAESAWEGPYAHLPRFVEGSARCKVPGSDTDARATFRPVVRPTSRAQRSDSLVRVADSENPDICSGPVAWCLLFGPSTIDQQNERIRLRMKKMHDEKTRQAEHLRERLHQVEATASAERQRHAEELRRLSETIMGSGIYLTNDESMSLASPQRLIWAIDHRAPLPASQVRPHELLNYVTFDTAPVPPGHTFSVLPEIAQHPARPDELTLGFSVRGRSSSRETRESANLAFVLDRSASMKEPGHLDFAKRGLLRALREMKDGDIVHLILFDATTCELARNFVVGRDPLPELRKLIEDIQPHEGSNLPDGLSRGYAAVNRVYQPEYSNRVILLTDIEAVPEEDVREAMNHSSRNFDARRVRLSALGLGADVDDKLLDQLTERGRGASIFLSSAQETDAALGERFVALIENAANDVHFRLQLPPSLTLRAFYGEEASSSRGRVQSVHYASGTTQMYLANLVKAAGGVAETDRIALRIEYDDPKSGRAESSDYSWSAAELGFSEGGKVPERAGFNLTKARMVATFGYHLRSMAERHARHSFVWQHGTQIWKAPTSLAQDSLQAARSSCLLTQGRLDAFAAELQGEAEARRIAQLWMRYCERFPAPAERFSSNLPPALAQTSSRKRVPLTPALSPPLQAHFLPINDFLPSENDYDAMGFSN